MGSFGDLLGAVKSFITGMISNPSDDPKVAPGVLSSGVTTVGGI